MEDRTVLIMQSISAAAHRRFNSQTISWFWDLYNRKLLDLSPPYQRRSVWNASYKEYFIETILLQLPSPAIFLYQEILETGVTEYSVVDGKQRLSTIFEFIQGEFAVSETSQVASLKGKYFDAIGAYKTAFYAYPLSVEYLPTVDEATLNNIFDRINRNTAKLTAQELRHARFSGVFISTAERLAELMETKSPDVPRIVSTSRKQMKDTEFVAELLLLEEEGPRGHSINDLDKAFSDRDDAWEGAELYEERFRTAFDTSSSILTAGNLRNTRFRNQADYYSLFGAVDKLLLENALVDEDTAADRLADFLSELENPLAGSAAGVYYDAARSASNDTGPRNVRIDILTSLLRKDET
jgi:hypothetical protein